MVHNLFDRRDFISRAATAAASFASPGLIGSAATTLALAATGARAQEPRRGGVMNIILQPEPATLVLALNITSQNISTYCLFATGLLQPAIDNNNLSLISSEICDRTAQELQLHYTK